MVVSSNCISSLGLRGDNGYMSEQEVKEADVVGHPRKKRATT